MNDTITDPRTVWAWSCVSPEPISEVYLHKGDAIRAAEEDWEKRRARSPGLDRLSWVAEFDESEAVTARLAGWTYVVWPIRICDGAAVTAEDMRRLDILVESAMTEVESSLDPDSTIQPDDTGDGLIRAYNWGRGFRARVEAALAPR